MSAVYFGYSGYRFSDIECLSIDLPQAIAALRDSGDFAGEIRAIDAALAAGVFPHALRLRLLWERVIASGMQNDYSLSRADLLSVLRREHPTLDETGLDRILSTGHADFILKNGVPYYQDSAPANLLNCCYALFSEMEGKTEPPYHGEFTTLMHEMQNTGSASRYFRARIALRPDEENAALCDALQGKMLTVHLPIPAPCASQSHIRVLASSHPVTVSDAAQRTACIRAPFVRGEDYWVEFSYVNTAKYTHLDPTRVDPAQPSFDCAEEAPHIRFTPLIRALAQEIAGQETNPLVLARRVYDYICKYVRYSYLTDYLYIPNIPQFVALNGHGDCGAQALLFITLCRCLGIPAKWESGLAMHETCIGSHDWAMFYIAPYGWLYADLSRGGEAYEFGDRFTYEHYFGSIEPYRCVTCTAFQREFVPAKMCMRIDPYDSQNGEAETDERGLLREELISTRTLLSVRPQIDPYEC